MWALLGVAAALIVPRLDAQASEEGPALGVARVSLTNGDVTLRRGDSGDWVQATVNSPLVEGDTIATGPGSRTEVQLDYSNLVRLNQNTEATMASLGNRAYRVQLARGVLTYAELRGGDADVDIETPHVAVRPQKNGSYRVEVLGDETAVTVRSGEAQVASPQGVERLRSGRTMLVRGVGDDVEFRIVDADPRDDWDQWNERRDDILKKSDSYRYLSRSINGGEDLDHHGHWRHVSGYGYSWFPTVTVGWAPYRHGNWVWLDYYGWTWHSYEPWGWAPYHYGRWYHHASYGWGWYPGAYHHRHHWRPALVAFFGYGSHSGASFGVGFGGGFGHVGWVPLGPGEPFYPWYGRHFYGRGRGGNFNNTTIYVDNSVNIYNNYRNARHHNGVTVVDAQGFSRGLVNNPRSLRDTELRRATLMRGQIPVVPARESQGRVVRASAARGANNELLGRDGARRNGFFNRQTGRQTVRQSAGRVPFEQQRENVQRSVRAFADSDGRRSADARGAAGSQGRVARAGDSPGQSVVRGSTVRGTGSPADANRQRLEDRAGRTARAADPGGVRGSSEAQRRGGVRSGSTDASVGASNGRGNDWRRFGNVGSRSRAGSDSTATPSRAPRDIGRAPDTSRAPNDNGSISRIDRSTSRSQPSSRVRQASPSPSDSNSSATPSRNRSSDVSRSRGSSRVERAPAPSQPQRSAPSRAPSVERRAPSPERSAPRAAPAAPSGGGGVRGNRPSRSRSNLRSSNSGFTRFGAASSSQARVSRADPRSSSGRFAPSRASRVSPSSRGAESAAGPRSASSSARLSRSQNTGSLANSRVFAGSRGSRSDVSRNRSAGVSPSRSRVSAPARLSRPDAGRSVRSSVGSLSRSRSVSAPSVSSRSAGPRVSRSAGGMSRSSGGGIGRSISRGGSISRSSGGGVRAAGRSRGR
jgi:hypothetical protein